MAHPYNSARAEEHKRAHGVLARTGNHLPRRASGGSVHSDEKEDAAMIREAVAEHEAHDHPGKAKTNVKFKEGGHVEGEGARSHMGRRARGGHTKGGKGHVTNVIVAPQGGPPGGGMRPGGPPMPAAQPPMAAPPPRPPMAPPPGAMPPGAGMPPGGPPMGAKPPGMMKSGGGVKKVEEVGVPHEALLQAKKGGGVKKRDAGGPAGAPPNPGAGVPSNPSAMTPQQVQQIAQIRKAKMQAAQQQAAAQQQSGAIGPHSGMPPGSAGPMKKGGEVEVKAHKRRRAGGTVDMEAGAGGGEGRIEKTHEYGSDRGFKPKKVPLHAD